MDLKTEMLETFTLVQENNFKISKRKENQINSQVNMLETSKMQ